MESAFNKNAQDDPIDREVRKLFEEVEEAERLRRAVIEALMMLGSDAAP